jgi:hypothetical protein
VKEGIGSFASVSAAFSPAGPFLSGESGLIAICLSKMRVFEKGGACGKLGQENGLTVSQNSFLVLPSQKGYGQMCFEKSVRDIWLHLWKESTVSFRRTKH